MKFKDGRLLKLDKSFQTIEELAGVVRDRVHSMLLSKFQRELEQGRAGDFDFVTL